MMSGVGKFLGVVAAQLVVTGVFSVCDETVRTFVREKFKASRFCPKPRES